MILWGGRRTFLWRAVRIVRERESRRTRENNGNGVQRAENTRAWRDPLYKGFLSVVCVLRVGGREANVNFESIAQISLVPLHVEFFLLSFSVPSKQEIQSQGVGCYGLFRRRHFAVVWKCELILGHCWWYVMLPDMLNVCEQKTEMHNVLLLWSV